MKHLKAVFLFHMHLIRLGLTFHGPTFTTTGWQNYGSSDRRENLKSYYCRLNSFVIMPPRHKR